MTGTFYTAHPECAYELTTKDGGYLISDLRAAFETVEDKTNWKNPIDAIIAGKDLKLIKYAIEFFTGSGSMFKKAATGKLRVLASGYNLAMGEI